MDHLSFLRYLVFCMIIYLSACAPQTIATDRRTTPSSSPTGTTNETHPFPGESTSLSTAIDEYVSPPPIVSPTNSPPISQLLQRGCPTLVESDKPPLWLTGSVLFGTGKIIYPNYAFPNPHQPEDPYISAISSANLDLQSLLELPSEQSTWVYIAPNGTTFLQFERDELSESKSQATFFDLVSGRKTTISIPSNLDTVYRFTWLSDSRFQYVADVERTAGVGEKRIYVILDAISGQSEIFTEELSLPGYAFNPFDIDRGLPSGYAAVDPFGQFVLYTADTETGVEIRLRNLQTGEVIWQEPSAGLPASPTQAEWTADGEQVLFVTNVSDVEGSFRKIISLTREGQEEELPPQPYPALDENIPRYLTFSPSGRYLIYGVWEGAWEGPAFVVDRMNSTVGEICRPGVTFLDGHWLPNDQFVYRVLIEDGENLKHSLRVLDIPSWTTQILYETSPGFGINIFGWVPIEFPYNR